MRYSELKQILMRMTSDELDKEVVVLDEVMNECYFVLMSYRVTSDHACDNASDVVIKKDDMVLLVR